MKNRRKARELTLQVLYQADVRKIPPTEALKVILSHYHFKPDVEVFSRKLVMGTEKFLPWIDKLIKWYAKNWTLDRMTAVDRNILRFSIYELLLVKEVPPVVSINEAVEIAKRYGTEDSGKFINGILDKIRRERASEKTLKWGYLRQKLQNPFLKSFISLKNTKKAYLVGGFIRDNLLGKETKDLDIILDAPDFELVEKFARSCGKSPVVLDENLRRVILPDGYQMDFTLQKSSLEVDLLERDFTIDALCLDLDNLKMPNFHLLDIKNGLEHLFDRKIVLITAEALDKDPLRMLRAFRLKSQLDFEIDEHLLDLISRKSHLIEKVAKERIREEIFLIMQSPCAGTYLNHPAARKLMESILNSPVYPENLQYLEEILSPKKNFFSSIKTRLIQHLEKKIGNITRLKLLKLVSLILPSSVSGVEEIAARALTLSKKERKIIRKVINFWPFLEKLKEESFNSSKFAAFFLEGGEEVPEICLAAAVAKKEDTEYLKLVQQVLSNFFEKYSLILHPPKLVSGDELINLLGIKPGPLVNTILNKIHQAQIAGKVKEKKQALELAHQLLEKEKQ